MQEEKARTMLDNVKDFAVGKIKQTNEWLQIKARERHKRMELEETACVIDEASRLTLKAYRLIEELRVRLENSRVRY
mgnify:CR=1 FL=1